MENTFQIIQCPVVVQCGNYNANFGEHHFTFLVLQSVMGSTPFIVHGEVVCVWKCLLFEGGVVPSHVQTAHGQPGENEHDGDAESGECDSAMTMGIGPLAFGALLTTEATICICFCHKGSDQ